MNKEMEEKVIQESIKETLERKNLTGEQITAAKVEKEIIKNDM